MAAPRARASQPIASPATTAPDPDPAGVPFPHGGPLVLRTGVFDAGDLRRAHTRIAHEIAERNRGATDVVLVGLYTRGLAIARRLAAAVEEFEDIPVPVGALDV